MSKKLVHTYIKRIKKHKSVKKYISKGAFKMSTVLLDNTSNVQTRPNKLKIVYINKKQNVTYESNGLNEYDKAWIALSDDEKKLINSLVERND